MTSIREGTSFSPDIFRRRSKALLMGQERFPVGGDRKSVLEEIDALVGQR